MLLCLLLTLSALPLQALAAEAQTEGKSKNPAEEEQIETVVEAEEQRIERKSE